MTTRLWYILHSIINNKQLQNKSSANFLSRSVVDGFLKARQSVIVFYCRLWWWRLIVWYEENVKAPVPYKFEIPNPSFRLSTVSVKTRFRDPSRDI